MSTGFLANVDGNVDIDIFILIYCVSIQNNMQMSIEMLKINRFFDSEQHANVLGNLNVMEHANINENVKNQLLTFIISSIIPPKELSPCRNQ
jgi:hypothetical protein